jgi:hypothetical protein
MVESYPIDIEPAQIAQWLKAECELAPGEFRLTARRGSEARKIPTPAEAHLGDEECEDLTEVETGATLEIAPARANEGWLLRIVVEDEAGERFAGPAAAAEEAIDFGTFVKEFIRPERGLATVTAEVRDATAKARLDKLLADIESNAHVASGRSARPISAKRG